MSNLRNDTGTKFRKYPIHEMDQVYLVMDSWKSSIYKMAKHRYEFLKISNLRNGSSPFLWIPEIVQFTKWTNVRSCFQKILNLRNWPKHRYTFLKISNSQNGPSPYLVMDSWNSSIYEMDQSYIVIFRKCTIYEMAKIQIWISENIQFTKWPKSLQLWIPEIVQYTKWIKVTLWIYLHGKAVSFYMNN